VVTAENKIDHFIQKLHLDYDKRRYATQALIKIGKPAVELLILALAEDEVFIRRAAAEILGKIKDIRAVEPLIQTLKDPRYSIREVVAQALADLGDVRAIAPLRSVVQEEVKWKHQPARRALEKLGDTEFRSQETNRVPSPPFPQIKEIETSDTVKSTEIIAQLKATVDWQARQNYLATLVAMGARVVMPLVQVLQEDACSFYRYDIIQTLGKLRQRPAIEPLLQLLSDPSPQVRKESIQAVGLIVEKNSAEFRVVKLLINALQDESSQVRMAAARALGNIRDTRAITPLITVFKDEEVRETASEALAQMGHSIAPKLLPYLVSDDLKVRRGIEDTFVTLGQPITDQIIRQFQSDDALRRLQAIRILGRIKSHQVRLVLMKALHDDDCQVRVCALKAIGRQGRTTLEDAAIIRMLDDPHAPVRLTLVEILSDWHATDLLMRMLLDSDPQVSALAQQALIEIGKPTEKVLYSLLRSDNAQYQDYAARILFEIETRQIYLPPAEEDHLLEDDEMESNSSLTWHIAPRADLSERVYRALHQKQWITCLDLLQECAETGDEHLLECLCLASLDEDGYIQDASLQAIRAIATREPLLFSKLPAKIRKSIENPVGATIGDTGQPRKRKRTGNQGRKGKSPKSFSGLAPDRKSKATLSRKKIPTGFAIPEPPKAFTLNMESVQQKIAETVLVSTMLDSIFQEEAPRIPTAPLPSSAPSFKDLDNAHFAFLNMLTRQSSWTRSEVEAIATPLGLMTDGAIERINEIALDIRDDFAFEGENPIEVNVTLIKEMLT
jgi:HEAT repeat protein